MTLPLPPRWARRALLHPLFVLLGAAVFVVLLPPALLGLPWLLDGRRRSLRALRLLEFAVVYLGLELVVIPLAGLTWLASGCGRAAQAAAFIGFHDRLLAAVVELLVKVGSRLFLLRVEVKAPAPTPGTRPLLVISRHAGLGHSLLLLHQLSTEGGHRPRIVLSHSLQWDPMIDLVFNRLPMVFVEGGRGRRQAAVTRIREVTSAMRPGDALLIFPEGRHVTPKRRRHDIQRLRRDGREQAARRAEAIEHLMLPRTRGLQAALAARSDLDVAVVAHAGLDELLDARAVWRAVARAKTLRLHWRSFVADSVPRDDRALSTWVFAQWQHMDAWVGAQRAALSPPQPGGATGFV